MRGDKELNISLIPGPAEGEVDCKIEQMDYVVMSDAVQWLKNTVANTLKNHWLIASIGLG